jgi:alpha,alpha-trehalose phosphorylase
VIDHPCFPPEPWCLRETELRLDILAQSESLFALANGNVGWRGNLDEGEPHGLPGTYLNGVFEVRPLPYAEAGFGFPEAGQTMIDVHNAKLVRLVVDDQPFDVRDGSLLSHERVLDFRTGLLAREASWRSPAGKDISIRSLRLVSLVQRSIGAVCFEVRAGDAPLRVVLQSELVANEELPRSEGDPRVAAALHHPLRAEEHGHHDSSAFLVHRTETSRLLVAAAIGHVVDGPDGTAVHAESSPDLGRVTVIAELEPGKTLRLVKFAAHGWSDRRSEPAVRDQVSAALAGAMATGWSGLVDEQAAYLGRIWRDADIEIDGAPELQQAVRFALFHLVQAGARAEGRPIPAKGLTGNGYDGHAFWDTETFVLPVLTHVHPRSAAHALRWRQATLPRARARAAELGLAGAAFPWRTIDGQECSGYWPAGTAAFHVSADVADAVLRYVRATGDQEFLATCGLEVLVETARLWRSLGHHDSAGRFRIDGVTGPDEYSALADNNVYTNLMAAQNLRAAAEAAAQFKDAARDLGVSDEEAASWADAASAMTVPYDEDQGIHPQSEGFLEHERFDFTRHDPDHYPLFLHVPYFDLYRKQVVKQADLVLAMQLCPDAFSPEQKARNFAYYEAITVRDSSLSACTQAVVAAEVGHLRLAKDYLLEAAFMDLADLERNTRDGLHLASLAGVWIALVAGLAGMRDHAEPVRFDPRLPPGIDRLVVRLLRAGQRIVVEITPTQTTYRNEGEHEVALVHQDELLNLLPGTTQARPTPMVVTEGAPPSAPPGRAPGLRRRAADELA